MPVNLNSHFSFSHHTERKRSASYRNKVEMLHIVERQRNNASSVKAFLWSTPDGVWSDTACHEAHLRCMKQSLDRLHVFLPKFWQKKKWGGSFLFSTSFLPERVQISLIPIEIIAKLPPTALFAQNMCSWFNLYSMPQLLRYYDLFA